jgi:hypothetical protein
VPKDPTASHTVVDAQTTSAIPLVLGGVTLTAEGKVCWVQVDPPLIVPSMTALFEVP